ARPWRQEHHDAGDHESFDRDAYEPARRKKREVVGAKQREPYEREGQRRGRPPRAAPYQPPAAVALGRAFNLSFHGLRRRGGAFTVDGVTAREAWASREDRHPCTSFVDGPAPRPASAQAVEHRVYYEHARTAQPVHRSAEPAGVRVSPD